MTATLLKAGAFDGRPVATEHCLVPRKRAGGNVVLASAGGLCFDGWRSWLR